MAAKWKDLESHKNYSQKKKKSMETIWSGGLEEMDQKNSCPAVHENTCLVLYLYIIAEDHMLLQIC